MSSTVHDYRNPTHAHVDDLVRLIRMRHANCQLIQLAKVIIALPACFVAPLAISGLVNSILHRKGIFHPTFATLFSISSLILIPLLFRLELRTRGRFLDAEASALAIDHSPLYKDGPAIHSRSEWEYRNDRAALIFYIEIFLFGPRLLLDVWRQHKHLQFLSPIDHAIAVRILDQLAQSDHALDTSALQRENESETLFNRTLAYLQFHDWIDLSKDRTRAWLLAEARTRLT